MLDDKICGTYWLCRNENGSLWLVQDETPPTKCNGYFSHTSRATMKWLRIGEDVEDSTQKGDIKLVSSDFEPILHKLPEVTYEDGPLEIEICKSGRVYYYES